MRIEDMNSEDRFTVEGYRGIAWYTLGPETAPDADTDWTGIEQPTGMVRMVMVGDNRVFIEDPDDVEPLTEDYCSECGQVGCGHGVVS